MCVCVYIYIYPQFTRFQTTELRVIPKLKINR